MVQNLQEKLKQIVSANRKSHSRRSKSTHSYSLIESELSAWKRLVLAARECRVKGNVQGAAVLYRVALNCAKQAGLEGSEELSSFLAAELWSAMNESTEKLSTQVEPANQFFASNSASVSQRQ
jgi:hypothetical protein